MADLPDRIVAWPEKQLMWDIHNAEFGLPEGCDVYVRAIRVDELVTLVLKLARHVPDDKQIKAKALDYIKRKGLTPSPLRAETES